MDTEQKAKAYDEALKVARYIHDVTPSSSIAIAVCEQIFPEFKKESEDKKVRKWIINEIKIKHHNLDEDNVDFVDKAIAWLERQATPQMVEDAFLKGCNDTKKSLLKRQGEQKPAWSEEDERICRNIINDIANDKSICKFEISKGICDEQINWLKSLKDRYAWKPSDAQMQALKEACDKSWEPDGFDPLYTLYEQLKKLTE